MQRFANRHAIKYKVVVELVEWQVGQAGMLRACKARRVQSGKVRSLRRCAAAARERRQAYVRSVVTCQAVESAQYLRNGRR